MIKPNMLESSSAPLFLSTPKPAYGVLHNLHRIDHSSCLPQLPWQHATSIFAWMTAQPLAWSPLFFSCSPLASVYSQCTSQKEPVENQVRPCHPSDPKPISLSVKVTVFALANRPNIIRSDLLVSVLWLFLL